MEFNDYQILAKKTKIYPGEVTYPILGLVSEAGEVAGVLKRVFRDNNCVMEGEYKAKLKLELGDCLWYIASIASDLELDLDDIAEANLTKLATRKDKNTIKGSGDNR